MGQTLTHGIYLPEEGERNCYDGLAANWQLLDGAVGTIAEHTSALSGKAPLVHTHTKADITDFPALANVATSGSYNDLSNIPASFTPASHTHGNLANDGKIGTTANKPLITGTGGVVQAGSFGTSANTFCEGNDSRLSDARTPVAHTHTKSDVTDLLNSDFIPSANNAYNLGSSSYQWNNLYAKNYYYNGIAWGLDKANVWTGNNTFNVGPTIYGYSNIRNSNMEQGTVPQNVLYNGIFFSDKNNNLIGSIDYVYGTSGVAQFDVRLSRNNANANRVLMFSIALPQSGNGTVTFDGDVLPKVNNTYDLGSSSYKWKTLNGENPGALSLPDTLGTSGTENVNYFNVIGYLNNTGTLATIPSAATYDGWLYINAKDGADSYIIIDDSPASFGTSVFGNNGLGSQSIGLLCLMCPIRKGHAYNVRIKSAGIVSARIYPAQGNV